VVRQKREAVFFVVAVGVGEPVFVERGGFAVIGGAEDVFGNHVAGDAAATGDPRPIAETGLHVGAHGSTKLRNPVEVT